MPTDCYVCGNPVTPGADGKVQLEGVSHVDSPKAWAWGPEVVHDDCGPELTTPLDNRIGVDHQTTWQRMIP